MKTGEEMPHNSHYKLLLQAFDKAQTAFERAVTNEKTAKHYLKTASSDISKNDKKILELEYQRAKHRRKARKAAHKIAKIRLKQWAKTHSIDEKIYTLNENGETHVAKQSVENQQVTNNTQAPTAKTSKKIKVTKEAISPQSNYTAKNKKVKTVVAPKAVEVKVAEPIVVKTETPKPEKKTPAPLAKKTEATAPKTTPKPVKVVEKTVVLTSKKEITPVKKAVEKTATKKPVVVKVETVKPVKAPKVTPKPVKTVTRVVKTEVKTSSQDLTLIEGIGPKINDWLQAAGITTFSVLAATKIDTIKNILISHKNSFTDPSTWAEQAALAAQGKMDDLKALQAKLKGGKR